MPLVEEKDPAKKKNEEAATLPPPFSQQGKETKDIR